MENALGSALKCPAPSPYSACLAICGSETISPLRLTFPKLMLRSVMCNGFSLKSPTLHKFQIIRLHLLRLQGAPQTASVRQRHSPAELFAWLQVARDCGEATLGCRRCGLRGLADLPAVRTRIAYTSTGHGVILW